MDCLGHISWLIHEGLDSTADMSTFFVYKISLQADELFQKVYEKRVTLFNRSCVGQVLQLHQDCTWTLSPIEKASGSLYKVKGHITNLHKNYNLTKDYQNVFDTEDPLDRTHAGFSMALSYHTYRAAQAISEPLKTSH